MGKLIKCRCSEPIAHSKKAKQPWADVWIRYTSKPGRKTVYYGPTLISKGNLERELEFERRFQVKYPDESDIDLKDLENALKGLQTQDIVVGDDWEYGTPTIYTSREFIDRDEAERMITAMMKHLGFKDVRFKWKRPRYLVCPVG